MKHKNLLDSYKTALENISSGNVDQSQIPQEVLSGSEPTRLSKSQKSLESLKKYKTEQEIKKQQALERLHGRKVNPVDPATLRPPSLDPNRFQVTLARHSLHWLEFLQIFRTIPKAWMFTREDFKRYWLLSAGASIEEIAMITGYSIEPIQRWMKLIDRKINHNPQPSIWIQNMAPKVPIMSGNFTPAEDSTKRNTRLDKLHKLDSLRDRVAKCTSPIELRAITQEIEDLKNLMKGHIKEFPDER